MALGRCFSGGSSRSSRSKKAYGCNRDVGFHQIVTKIRIFFTYVETGINDKTAKQWNMLDINWKIIITEASALLVSLPPPTVACT